MNENDDAHAQTLGLADDAEVKRARQSLSDHVPELLNDRYQMGELLGTGSFGSVYKAIDTRLEKAVAVKLLDARWAERDKDFERFRQEAMAASRLNHPGIIIATDFDVLADGRPYMVMEFVEGETLEEVIKREAPLSIPHAIGIARTLCTTLSAAHGARIVHRDLKPANVIVGRDTSGTTSLKILDFGMAKLEAGNAADLTNTGRLLGTPSYMAPEQVRDMGVLDGRADLYAVGVILYEMLTGQTPFGSRSVSDVLVAKVIENPKPITEHRSDLPRGLEQLVMRSIHRRPDRRPANAGAMDAELARVLHAVETGTSSTGGVRWWSWAVAVLAVLALAAVFLSIARQEPPVQAPVERTRQVTPTAPVIPVAEPPEATAPTQAALTSDASIAETPDAAEPTPAVEPTVVKPDRRPPRDPRRPPRLPDDPL